jgi:hypothetical protein
LLPQRQDSLGQWNDWSHVKPSFNAGKKWSQSADEFLESMVELRNHETALLCVKSDKNLVVGQRVAIKGIDYLDCVDVLVFSFTP